MKRNIIVISPETNHSDIIKRLEELEKNELDDTVVFIGNPTYNFSEIPKLSITDDFKLPDPEEYEKLPPEPTCPPAQFGMNKVNKRKKKLG